MRWTTNEELTLVDLRRGGMTIADIARAMQRTRKSIENKLGALGCLLEPRWTSEEIARLLAGEQIDRTRTARKVMRCRVKKGE